MNSWREEIFCLQMLSLVPLTVPKLHSIKPLYDRREYPLTSAVITSLTAHRSPWLSVHEYFIDLSPRPVQWPSICDMKWFSPFEPPVVNLKMICPQCGITQTHTIYPIGCLYDSSLDYVVCNSCSCFIWPWAQFYNTKP